MTPFYTAYAKSINGTTFYFVKSFKTFPEYKTVPPLLQTYGMHTDFDKACQIAEIYDKDIQQELINKLANDTSSAKLLPVYPGVAEIYSLRRTHASFPSLLRLLRLG